MDADAIFSRTDGGGADGFDAGRAYQAGAGPGRGPFSGETPRQPRTGGDGVCAGGISRRPERAHGRAIKRSFRLRRRGAYLAPAGFSCRVTSHSKEIFTSGTVV